mmetsp:Transcript_35627/g.54486  ORF Transcript_35627/g.54486 Transcript_35627/m.54486 type:complete len:276 (+) Transcript_35627:146-973(+)
MKAEEQIEQGQDYKGVKLEKPQLKELQQLSNAISEDAEAYLDHGREDIEAKLKAILVHLEEAHPSLVVTRTAPSSDLKDTMQAIINIVNSENGNGDEKKEELKKSSDGGPSDEDLFQIAKSGEQTEPNKLVVIAKMFSHFQSTDDFIMANRPKHGGFQIQDKELLKRLRSAGTELLKSVGRKILSGNFNLTSISFPIKCMGPRTLLMTIPAIQKVFSFYLNYAASLSDPVERMKAVMTSTIAFLWRNHAFDKPLNPVLGETFQARSPDGGMIYME